ncbi:hypothetical protein D3C87_1523350 [compost metagenome]
MLRASARLATASRSGSSISGSNSLMRFLSGSGAMSLCGSRPGSRRRPALAGSSSCLLFVICAGWRLAEPLPLPTGGAGIGFMADQSSGLGANPAFGSAGAASTRSMKRASSKYLAFFVRIGGMPATMTISSSGGSCIISPGVSKGRAVSDRETIRCDNHGASRCPA